MNGSGKKAPDGNINSGQSGVPAKEIFEANLIYRQIIDSALNGVIVYGTDMRYQLWNPYMEKLTGMSAEDVLGRLPLEIWPFLKDTGVIENIEKALGGQEPDSVDFEYPGQKSGRQGWATELCAPMRNSAGDVIGAIGIVLDITERKSAEAALVESAARIRTISNNLANGLIYQVIRLNDGSRKFTHLSDKVMQFYGITPEQGMADANLIYSRIHEDDRMRVFQEEEQANETMSVFETEVRMLKPDGGIRWSYFVSNPRKMEDGSTCWDGIEFDITHHKQIEEALHVSEDRYRTLLDSTPNSIIIIDLNGTILECSAATLTMHGFSSRDELIGRPILSLFHPDEHEKALEGKTQILEKLTPKNKEYTFLKTDGTTFPVEISAGVVRDNHGAPISFIAIIRDITDRKQAEYNLKESERRYRQIVDTANEGICVLGDDFKVTFVNDRICDMMGYGREEIMGRNFEDFLFKEDIPDHRKKLEMRRKGLSGQYERRVLKKDGGTLWIIISGAPIIDEQGRVKGAFAMFTDITDKKKAEEERQKLQQQLIHSQKMEVIGQLAGGIAHDFNNILAVIIGTAEMSLRDAGHEDPMGSRIQRILKVANRAKDLTMKLLTFARKEKLDMRRISVDTLITELEDMLEQSISRDIQISIQVEKPKLQLMIDFNQVLQSILNICINAGDAMPDGGNLSIKTTEVLIDEKDCRGKKYMTPGVYCLIQVSDTGHGFSREISERIFEPFFTTKGQGKGTGLGLSIALGIIQSHTGHLEVESREGKGTTVSIYLPAADSRRQLDETNRDSEETGVVNATVMIVDDDHDFLTMAEEMLSAHGYNVVSVSSGMQALEIYRHDKTNIDVVLLDMIMPEMDGSRLFHEIKKLNPDVRAILCSGFSIDEKAREILSEGIEGYLQKPFQSKDLFRVISQILTN